MHPMPGGFLLCLGDFHPAFVPRGFLFHPRHRNHQLVHSLHGGSVLPRRHIRATALCGGNILHRGVGVYGGMLTMPARKLLSAGHGGPAALPQRPVLPRQLGLIRWRGTLQRRNVLDRWGIRRDLHSMPRGQVLPCR